jgi:hypothetical protein
VTVEGARARPDFVYDLASGPVAVFIDGPHHDAATQAARDASAGERLVDGGWDVVRVRHDQDWDSVVSTRPAVFGSPPIGRRSLGSTRTAASGSDVAGSDVAGPDRAASHPAASVPGPPASAQ